MAMNCIKVPRFLAQAAPRAVPGQLMCNSAGDATAATPDRSATKLRRVCTTRDTDLGTHKHGGQAVRTGAPDGLQAHGELAQALGWGCRTWIR